MSDNLLTSICRAWDIKNNKKFFIVAPAMNTLMWSHPFTEKQLKILKEELNVKIIEPIIKKQMCNEIGNGAMAELSTIVEYLNKI